MSSASSQQKDRTERTTCPCKRFPIALSSFTAAEYGDLAVLSSRCKSNKLLANKSDDATLTPLHLAAQHGHVAATAYLLQHYDVNTTAAATPLHRASFSGAVATMRLLMNDSACNLLARDTSFGDNMTPLHKAASGGRYLAVELLLSALEEQNLLEQALQAVDATGATPLEVARARNEDVQQERASVARWNQVAGGVADWHKCIKLLESAAANDHSHRPLSRRETRVLSTNLPSHLTSRELFGECGDCEGECRTKSWEMAFQTALQSSFERRIDEAPPPLHVSPSRPTTENVEERANGPSDDMTKQSSVDTSNLGRCCDDCGKVSFGLFPRNGQLVCKACRRSRM